MRFGRSVGKYLERLNYGKVGKDILINKIGLSNCNKGLNIGVYDSGCYGIVGRGRNSVDFSCEIRVRG